MQVKLGKYYKYGSYIVQAISFDRRGKQLVVCNVPKRLYYLLRHRGSACRSSKRARIHVEYLSKEIPEIKAKLLV